MERGGGKGSSPLDTKDPPGGTHFSFTRTADECAPAKSDIFSGGGRPESVGGKEDPKGRGGEEQEEYNRYSIPEDSAKDYKAEEEEEADQDFLGEEE